MTLLSVSARRLITAALLSISFLPASVMASEHEKTAGLLGGYTTRNSTAVAGIYFSYRFAPYYRVQPSIEYYFRKDGVDGSSSNIDNQFPIAIGAQKRCNFYPLAGFSYSTYSRFLSLAENKSTNTGEDTSRRTNRLGLNAGAGMEWFITPNMRLAVEAKCKLMKNYTGGVFSAAIGYIF